VTGAGRGELEGTVRVSEIPAKATESEDPSDGARTGAVGDSAVGDSVVRRSTLSPLDEGMGDTRGGRAGDGMWQSSPPGSIYDYIKVASFSIGADGLVDQWSLRAEQLFGISADRAVGMDPIAAFVAPDRRDTRGIAKEIGAPQCNYEPEPAERRPHPPQDKRRDGEAEHELVAFRVDRRQLTA